MFYTERTFTLRERIIDRLSGGKLTAAEKERQREEAKQNLHQQRRAFALNYGFYYALQGKESLDFFLSGFPEDVQEYARRYLVTAKTYYTSPDKE